MFLFLFHYFSAIESRATLCVVAWGSLFEFLQWRHWCKWDITVIGYIRSCFCGTRALLESRKSQRQPCRVSESCWFRWRTRFDNEPGPQLPDSSHFEKSDSDTFVYCYESLDTSHCRVYLPWDLLHSCRYTHIYHTVLPVPIVLSIIRHLCLNQCFPRHAGHRWTARKKPQKRELDHSLFNAACFAALLALDIDQDFLKSS